METMGMAGATGPAGSTGSGGPGMEEQAFLRAQPGMDVCDVDGQKMGTVAHLHDAPAVIGPMGIAPGGHLEVKTGFLGLGKHLFVPLHEVREVTEGGVILARSKAEAQDMGWERRPETQNVVMPSRQETAHPQGDVLTVPSTSAAHSQRW